MEAIEIKNLKVNILTLKILGIGSLGICFLLPNNKVLKIFINKSRIKELKYLYQDLISHFAEINSISNDTYMAPETLLIKDGSIIGYIATFARGRQLAHISPQVKLSNIIKAYKQLILATKKISEQNFKLGDVHYGNIIFDDINSRFFCIDLDHGTKVNLSSSSIMKLNMRALNNCIVSAIFGIDSYNKTIEFHDYRLQEIYNNATLREYEAIYDLLSYIQKEMGDDDVTCKTLKHKRSELLTKRTIINYYNDYL